MRSRVSAMPSVTPPRISPRRAAVQLVTVHLINRQLPLSPGRVKFCLSLAYSPPWKISNNDRLTPLVVGGIRSAPLRVSAPSIKPSPIRRGDRLTLIIVGTRSRFKGVRTLPGQRDRAVGLVRAQGVRPSRRGVTMASIRPTPKSALSRRSDLKSREM